jgi:hypothetical protein
MQADRHSPWHRQSDASQPATNSACNQHSLQPTGLKMSFSLRRLRMGPLRTKARQKRKRLVQRVVFLEQLEPRIVLNGAPVALPDPFYETAEDTALTITTSNTTLLDNDWDPEGDTITASIVDNPSDGSVSNFSGSNGTFTYTPDTAFTGVDTFTYQINDDTDDGNTVSVSIAVGRHLGGSHQSGRKLTSR